MKKDSGLRLVNSRINAVRMPSDLILVTDRWTPKHTMGGNSDASNPGEHDNTGAFHIRPATDNDDSSSEWGYVGADYNWRHKGSPPILFVDNHVAIVNYLKTVPNSCISKVTGGWGCGHPATGSWSDDPEQKKDTCTK